MAEYVYLRRRVHGLRELGIYRRAKMGYTSGIYKTLLKALLNWGPGNGAGDQLEERGVASSR